MLTAAAVPPFSARILSHWFEIALREYFSRGGANSFVPWSSSMKTQGPEEHGLVQLIETGSPEEQIILYETLKHFIINTLDTPAGDTNFWTNVFDNRSQTFKVYLDVLSLLDPVAMFEVLTKAVASDGLASLQSIQKTSMFVSLFWDTQFSKWSKMQKSEVKEYLLEWKKKHPEQSSGPRMERMLSALSAQC